MIPRPIEPPVEGEQLAAVVPKPSLVVDAGWRRRLNLFAGRSLSDVALQLEQGWRAGHLSSAGQRVSYGVVSGLEIGLEERDGQLFLDLGTGLGITASGEDVVVPQALRVAVEDLWIYLPVSGVPAEPEAPVPPPRPPILDLPRPGLPAGPGGPPGGIGRSPRVLAPTLRDTDAESLPRATPAPSLPLRPPPLPPYALRGPLRSLREQGVPLPRVVIAVLEPTTAEVYGARDALDPCEQDPRDEAFADWQLIDGCRLVLYAWPWARLPGDSPTRRNEIAYTVFEMEERRAPGEVHPWERVGVAVGLLDLGRPAAGSQPAVPPFLDSHAVVRDGGRPRRRTVLLDGVGSVFLWQARIQQFAEQLAEVDWNTARPEEVFRQIRFFPPAGLLPKKTVDLEKYRTPIFPLYYDTEAVPVPLEQLEAVLDASAALEPFDTTAADHLRVLVPVPQALYEPRLLHEEEVGQEFEAAIGEFSSRRHDRLLRREDVRRKAEALVYALTAGPKHYPDPREDPARLETELASDPYPSPGARVHLAEHAEGLHQHHFRDATDLLAVGAGEALFAYLYLDPGDLPLQVMLQWNLAGSWEHRAYWGQNKIGWGQDGQASRKKQADKLPDAGKWVRLRVPAADVGLEKKELNGMAFTLFGGRALWGRAGKLVPDSETGEEKEVVWLEGSLPAGAVAHGAQDGWRWIPFDQDFQLEPKEDQFGTQPRLGRPRAVAALDRVREVLNGAPFTAEERALLDSRGLQGFIEELDTRIRQADDRVDFGFLRVQTDMYRLRQLMLGEGAATRLATTPALAQIIKSESALTVREKLLDYLGTVKGTGAETSVSPTPTSAPAGPGTRSAVVGGTGTFHRAAFGFGSMNVILESAVEGIAPRVQVADPTPPTATQAAIRESVVQPVFMKARPALLQEVLLGSPIVGEAYDFRTVTVAERLRSPLANEARSFSVATKYEIVTSIAKLPLNLANVEIPGLITVEGTEVKLKNGLPVRQTLTFDQAHGEGKPGFDLLILGEPSPQNGDEAAFFSAGVDILDSAIATLRNVEGRIQEYRNALQLCREALGEVTERAREADRRLKTIEDELAEARHDVAVARALLADEARRVEEVNRRRKLILRDDVHFLAYHRPRVAHGYLDAPARPLDPAYVESPVPACLAEQAEAPPELRAMVELLREAPIRWFRRAPELLRALDGVGVMLGTIRNAKIRAERSPAPGMLEQPQGAGRGLLSASLGRTFGAQQRVVAQHRLRTAKLDLSRIADLSWQRAQALAEQHLSLGDLIDASHGRTSVDRGAAGELDDVLRVATCLYARFSEVSPRIRLEWAEQLSEHDEGVNLRNLYSLPRWGEVEYLDRREMQSLADWLYGRVEPQQPEAVAMTGDLIRVCLLLASHAPVGQILAAAAPKQTTARVGETVELAVDLSRVRVGMPVLVYDRESRPVHAVVEDLAGGVAVSRIVQAAAGAVTIPQGARAQLGGMLPGPGASGLPGAFRLR